MRLYFVANARMPTERAYGIHIAKMCEAFIEEGLEVVVVAPKRRTDARSLREYYGLRTEVPLVCLFAFDWYTKGRVLYRLSSFSFMVSSWLFLFRRRHEDAFVYTRDADDWSYGLIPFVGLPYVGEMHSGKRPSLINRLFFRRAAGIVVLNALIKKQLTGVFVVDPAHILVQPDGVDDRLFVPIARNEARRMLGLPLEKTLVLYTGRILSWKGLEIIAPAAAQLGVDVTIGVVGGTLEEFKRAIKGPVPSNLTFFGSQPFTAVPRWIAAADLVVLTGTKHDENSYYWTSPMKLFEYMAMGIPMVAVNTPAVRQIIGEREAFFYEPDDAQSFARAIQSALTNRDEAAAHAAAALANTGIYTWRGRVHRIIEHLRIRL